MQKRKTLNRMFGIATLTMLFGVTPAQAQSSQDASGMTQKNQAGQMNQSGQSDTSGASTAGQGSSSGAQAGSGTSDTAASSGKSAGGKTLSKTDQNLMREMAHSNLSEIEAAKIALEQSKNDQVKAFAQKMIDDHTQAQKELEQLAQAKGVTLPTEPDNKHKAAAKKLSALEGDKFDKRYMAQGGLSDHRNTHRLLNRAQQRATDPDLKALAQKMAPIVNAHLTMAQDYSSGKGATSGSSMGPAGTSSTPESSGSSGEAGSSGVSGTSGSSNSTSPGKQ